MKTFPNFSGLVQSFFTDRLMNQREASPHTIISYRNTFCLLLDFAQKCLKKEPTNLSLGDLDAEFIVSFLNYLEKDRKNTARSRNARLAAIHSFFRYAALYDPSHMRSIQRVLAIPTKRYTRKQIGFLIDSEIDALLEAPDRRTWAGRRDRALLLVAVKTGMRASELIGLRCQDIVLGNGAYIYCCGKGRKERRPPLPKEIVPVLRNWVTERNGSPEQPLFPNARGGKLSHDGLAYIVKKHVATARQQCPSMEKKRTTPHVLRHSMAMDLLHHKVDRSVISIYLGHESPDTTYMYLHASPQIKENAIAKVAPSNVPTGRYRPSDELRAFLKSL